MLQEKKQQEFLTICNDRFLLTFRTEVCVAKKFISLALVVLYCFSSASCASIVGRDMFPLTVNSNPDGANILIADEKGTKVFSGVTPTTVTLAAGEAYFHAKEYRITFSKTGYGDQFVSVKATLSGWYFGNILFGGLIGLLIIDPITGKMWKLPEAAVTGNLSPKLTKNEDQRALKVMTLSQIPESMRKDLVPINLFK